MHRPPHRNALLTLVAAVVVLAWFTATPWQTTHQSGESRVYQPAAVQAAFAEHRSGVWLEVTGRVTRILADDNEGSRHQRFVIALADGHTVLVSHNMDVAQRVPVRQGDSVSLRGRFEWNERGGVIHWTHHDPRGTQTGGWIRYDNRTYR